MTASGWLEPPVKTTAVFALLLVVSFVTIIAAFFCEVSRFELSEQFVRSGQELVVAAKMTELRHYSMFFALCWVLTLVGMGGRGRG